MDDFLFRGDLAEVDKDVAALTELEALRQAKRLILIPSESSVPQAVRQTVGSVFHNIYAEGYPPSDWHLMDEETILDIDARLAELRRYGSRRYYQGTEIADIIESLAQHRTAERFANERVSADQLHVNVQPLSGAPANSAVYTALLEPGDTLMGMNLLHGGHLTHGSPIARSGLQYQVASYGVNLDTEKLNYDDILQLALEHRPKIIIAGYTSYPWAPNWEKFRTIADTVGAYLLADVSHTAGLIIGGVYPSPIGIADVVMFTTHKSIAGPRGAVLLTHKANIAKKINRGVFPGEQGGPHVNSIAALAVAMKIAGSVQFKALQQQTVYNAKHLANSLQERGFRIVNGGTDTHMVLVDVGQIKGQDGTPLSGDMAARLLDIAGIVCNRNTIPGDKSAFSATGIRLGTNWITQRGFREAEIDQVADIMATLLFATKPFSYAKSFSSFTRRAKVDYHTLVKVQQQVHQLTKQAGIDYAVPTLEGYFEVSDAAAEHFRVLPEDEPSERWHSIEINGTAAGPFLNHAVTSDVMALDFGDWQSTWVLNGDGEVLAQGIVERLTQDVYLLHVSRNVDEIAQWLIGLSDGYTQFDPTDIHAKTAGPVSVSTLPDAVALHRFEGLELADTPTPGAGLDETKPYFVGCHGDKLNMASSDPLPTFSWQEAESADLLQTPLHDLHIELGAKMVPFAGYNMPVWYSSVSEEHQATRTQAGLFDVAHMGVFEITGTSAEDFLNDVTTNDVSLLAPGEAHYSYLLDIDGIPHDDIFVYRLATDRFMMVVNASNNDKDWAWLNSIKDGKVQIDPQRPWVKASGHQRVTLRDLRASSSGRDRRVDLALQGPTSREILLSLEGSEEDKAHIRRMKWADIVEVKLGGYDLIISRTGYTGERMAFELFVHPDQAADLFQLLVNKGATPCGLAARDSLRTEAGLPLYGNELAGELRMNPADAGFISFVKLWKPFFIGKQAFIDYEAKRDRVCTRFRMDHKGVRPPHIGDPILDRRGRVIGIVTSCSIDMDGYQTGQALLKTEHTTEGTPILIFSNAAHSKAGKSPADLTVGERTKIPDTATVLSRFPRRRK